MLAALRKNVFNTMRGRDPYSRESRVERKSSRPASSSSRTRRFSPSTSTSEPSSPSSRSNSRRQSTAKTVPKEVDEAFGSKLDCSKRVPASAINFEMVTAVVVSWEQGIKKIPNWPGITGELFLRKIFELDPETITMFGFPADTKYDDPSLASDPIFMGKAVRLIKAIDMAAGFLGPDLQPLEDKLFQLGARHAAMQCRPQQWPMVGEALFYVFEQCMRGGGSTKSVRTSWTTIYNFLGYHMIRGLVDKCPRLADPQAKIESPSATRPDPASLPKPVDLTFASKLDCSKKTPLSAITYDKVALVVSSWDTCIKRIPNWAMITGESFLRHIFRRAPETITMFGFRADLKWDDPELKNDRRFIMKGIVLIKAIDMAVSCLGPDIRPLEKQLFDVGERHVALNCRPSQWPTVGEALFDVFEECMEEGEFTQELRNAWTLMYNFWGYHMILGLVHKCPELAST